jgi:UPF0042 nucleotide-binding protein
MAFTAAGSGSGGRGRKRRNTTSLAEMNIVPLVDVVLVLLIIFMVTASAMLRRTEGLLRFLVPHYIAEGKAYLTIAVGCTGGRHRSVALAQALADRLGPVTGIRLQVRHRDIAAEG